MTPRKQRMLSIGLIVVGVSLAVGLVLQAFQENLLFFYSPTQVIAGEAPAARKFRIGGLVEEGSVRRESGELKVSFIVSDLESSLPVTYEGVLPDLFREGKGVVAHGFLEPDGSFRAVEVLAKHDENYMAPEVAELLAEQGHPVGGQPADPVVN